jgi:hypothetical protein
MYNPDRACLANATILCQRAIARQLLKAFSQTDVLTAQSIQ